MAQISYHKFVIFAPGDGDQQTLLDLAIERGWEIHTGGPYDKIEGVWTEVVAKVVRTEDPLTGAP